MARRMCLPKTRTACALNLRARWSSTMKGRACPKTQPLSRSRMKMAAEIAMLEAFIVAISISCCGCAMTDSPRSCGCSSLRHVRANTGATIASSGSSAAARIFSLTESLSSRTAAIAPMGVNRRSRLRNGAPLNAQASRFAVLSFAIPAAYPELVATFLLAFHKAIAPHLATLR